MTPVRRGACCTCGKVELEAMGVPITSVVCYCDDCQAGAQQIETLPNAGVCASPTVESAISCTGRIVFGS
jgi:hypothetical protein